jgi:alpha-glucan,water dikinase
VTTAATARATVDYSSDPLLADPALRLKVMTLVARAGAEIEAALGGAQDVEGVLDHDLNLFVVQTRPQQ